MADGASAIIADDPAHPDQPGCYALLLDSRVVYIGKAAHQTIRERVKQHVDELNAGRWKGGDNCGKASERINRIWRAAQERLEWNVQKPMAGASFEAIDIEESRLIELYAPECNVQKLRKSQRRERTAPIRERAKEYRTKRRMDAAAWRNKQTERAA